MQFPRSDGRRCGRAMLPQHREAACARYLPSSGWSRSRSQVALGAVFGPDAHHPTKRRGASRRSSLGRLAMDAKGARTLRRVEARLAVPVHDDTRCASRRDGLAGRDVCWQCPASLPFSQSLGRPPFVRWHHCYESSGYAGSRFMGSRQCLFSIARPREHSPRLPAPARASP